ncbi:GRIP1-associated protein 1 [Zerene cesonia]|uniref:GRIP1-associated protein 1 n=1 Tax=Zerene cesonia TaxID=33412 RepID=UPI0018E4ECE2|nr:GRIP1-associated protein 1 [Zerene cesonia]
MLPNRYVPSQSSAMKMRKSRLEGKPSLLPKLRQGGSTERMSTESRRPSTTGPRSSSAEPGRGTFGSHYGKEASASKLPLNRRSRSQTGEARYDQPAVTPQRGSQYMRQPTTTPVRTPSQERANRSWQISLERALAFVTIKDQRPISSVAWQRAENARVAEALGARGEPGALIRPLTIARFVDIVGALLAPVFRDALNNDNYVAKLPHLSKRLLYPGAVSKSWLRTVNTLHAFPHALALISYLLDLITHIERPVSNDWLYVGKDELSCLRRDYLSKCWVRFQKPGHQYEDLNEEYLQNLQKHLGNDEEKIAELQMVIKKYEEVLDDEEEASARAEEERVRARSGALGGGVRAARAARRQLAAQRAAHEARAPALRDALRALRADIERAKTELEGLRSELEKQTLSVEERTRLLDEVDYSLRVHDSKRALADNVAKTIISKENELAVWQKKTLDSCMQYKEALIHLTPDCPQLASLAVDEKELMEASCGAHIARAAEELKRHCAALAARRSERARDRTALQRRRAAQLEEARAKITELKSAVEREQQALEVETAQENSAAAEWSSEEALMMNRIQELRNRQHEYKKVEDELQFWETQDKTWQSRLSTLREYVAEQRQESSRKLEDTKQKLLEHARNALIAWNTRLDMM